MSMQFHDEVMQSIRDKQRTCKFNIGDKALMIGSLGELFPVLIQGIEKKYYLDSMSYVITSVDYPSSQPMHIHPKWLRPIMRTQQELKQIMRIVQ